MIIKLERLRFKEACMVLIFFLLIGFSFFNQYISIFSYLDETIAIIAVLILFIKYGYIKNNRMARSIILYLLLIVFIGILGNINSSLIRNILAIMIDAFGVVKNHIVFITFSLVMLNGVDYDKIIRFLIPFVKVFVTIVFILGIINFFHDIGMSYNVYGLYRYGMRSYQFLYTNPAMVGIVMLSCIALFDYMHYRGIVKYFAFGAMLLTLRAAILASVAVYFALHLFLKFSAKIRWYHILLTASVALLAGWGMVNEYFLSNTSNRYILLYYGIEVFKRYFPLGSGFATYGSQMAYTNYSKLYTEFGFNNIWGLNIAYGGTVNDNFWPMIMAQLGIFGLIAMVAICFREFQIINNSTENKSIQVGLFTLFFSLMIGTTASADLTGVAGMIRYFPLALIVAACNSNSGQQV